MKIQEFETKLQQIDSRLRIVPHPSNEDVAGVYCEEMFIITVPSKEIYEDTRRSYTDIYGRPHRNSKDAEAIVNNFLERIKEPEYLKFVKGEE